MAEKRKHDITDTPDDDPCPSISSTSTSIKKRFLQPTLFEITEKTKIWDINDRKSTEIHFKIGEMIAVDNLKFSFVEDIGFKRLINHVCPQNNIPSRRYFSQEIIPTIYKRVKNKITLQLQEIQAISLP